jgi:glycosyltransferase involved in cell wall biosynthesis
VFELVIPARNEAEHVGHVIRWARDSFQSDVGITVVDNASTDATAAVAWKAGADRVLHEERIGKGYAVTTGLADCRSSHVMLCDADIVGLPADALQALRQATADAAVPVGRLALGREPEDAPVTTLLARPLLTALGFGTYAGDEPLGGLMLVEREFVLGQHLPGGWGFDVACTLSAVRSGNKVLELPVAGVRHRRKKLAEYIGMSAEVCSAILRVTEQVPWDHADCTRCQGT